MFQRYTFEQRYHEKDCEIVTGCSHVTGSKSFSINSETRWEEGFGDIKREKAPVIGYFSLGKEILDEQICFYDQLEVLSFSFRFAIYSCRSVIKLKLGHERHRFPAGVTVFFGANDAALPDPHGNRSIRHTWKAERTNEDFLVAIIHLLDRFNLSEERSYYCISIEKEIQKTWDHVTNL